MSEERTWEESISQVEKFHTLAQEIPSGHDQKTIIGIFDVHCDELISGLGNRAADMRDKLLEKMIHELHMMLKKYFFYNCSCFQQNLPTHCLKNI